ncbi:hypothetical protein [Paraglaciecola aestuariivivens]
MSNTIIINASAAKYGGAKTIVDSFVAWIQANDSQSQFILLCPESPERLPSNVTFVKKHTAGMWTWLFSCFGIIGYCVKYRASHCISFNNVNLLLPLCRRITYFHQAKVFSEKSLRFRLIGLAIMLLRGSTIVLQSPLIKQRFIQFFSAHYKLLVKWPGITPEPPLPVNQPDQIKADKQKLVLWPVTDPSVWQKNQEWFVQNQAWLSTNNIQLLVTANNTAGIPNAKALGQLSRAQLFDYYAKVDAVLIVSIEETLCLPIFEAASVGAQVWVLNQAYIRAIEAWRGLPKTVQLFNQADEIQLSLTKQSELKSTSSDYYQADWQIY